MRFRRSKWLGLICEMLLYTFGFAVALFGTWILAWLTPILGITLCFTTGLGFEQLIHSRYGELPAYNMKIGLAELGVLFAYAAAPMFASWHDSPKALLAAGGQVSSPQIVAVAVGILIYAFLMARAAVVYRKWLSTATQY